jgi:hypothetical protein
VLRGRLGAAAREREEAIARLKEANPDAGAAEAALAALKVRPFLTDPKVRGRFSSVLMVNARTEHVVACILG